MEDIVDKFFDEVNYIENSSLFMEDDENEPKTEWVEEMDSRTNCIFYWNSITKESVWDKPESYDEYISQYESYLKNILKQHFDAREKQKEETNLKKQIEMRDLLGYSDSEEEEDEEITENEEKDNLIEEIITEDKVEEEVVLVDQESEESGEIKNERWINEQTELASEYLRKLVKNMSDTAVKKLELLKKDISIGESLLPVGIRVQTRLEDWEGGHLSLERTAEKLAESVTQLSEAEGGLESVEWQLVWDETMGRYFQRHRVTGGTRRWGDYEDGEIVDEGRQEDLTEDLQEYVLANLNSSPVPEKEPMIIDDNDDGEANECADDHNYDHSIIMSSEEVAEVPQSHSSLVANEIEEPVFIVQSEAENGPMLSLVGDYQDEDDPLSFDP